ncbi:MAG: SGNH/GDSL hydrolase family protein [Thiolinea sp.]
MSRRWVKYLLIILCLGLSLACECVQVLDAFSILQGETDLIQDEYSRDLLHLNAQGYEALNAALKSVLQP